MHSQFSPLWTFIIQSEDYISIKHNLEQFVNEYDTNTYNYIGYGVTELGYICYHIENLGVARYLLSVKHAKSLHHQPLFINKEHIQMHSQVGYGVTEIRLP